MSRFEILRQGHVCKRQPGDATPVAAGPRIVVAGNGDLVCTYMVQTKLAINDFIPVLARSTDGGKTWRETGAVWPGLIGKWSLFVSVSRDQSGRLFLFGSRCPIDTPGESFWSDATQGLKQNEMIWADSTDHGLTWSQPRVIGNLMPGSAEAPGAMAVTSKGIWVGPYSPYNTFDPALKVEREQVVTLRSADQGKTWRLARALKFDEPNSGGAEAWCCELADGRLLATTWHIDHTPGPAKRDFPNKWSLSRDGGATWGPTRSTGIMGHTTALAALPASLTAGKPKALFVNVRRKPASDIGIWLALVAPTDTDFGVEHNQLVWSAASATQHDTSAEHDNWSDYSFGEPAAAVLPDGSVVLVLWYVGKSDSGIRYVHLRDTKAWR